ncbi:hypothetical protein ACNOYE_35860 [Nannocystaceae bacterium ST9]
MSASPEFQQFLRGPLTIVRWRQPTVEASARLSTAIERHHREQGCKLFFAAIIGVDCPPPAQEVRDAMMTDYQRTWAYCQTSRMVVLGSGMSRALVRSVLAGMGLAAGLRGKGFAVDGSVRELAGAAEKLVGTSPKELIAGLSEAGLISAEEAGV